MENTVGKGEIARYEQFLLFPQCFQKVCFLGASKGVIVWEWVKSNKVYNFVEIESVADYSLYVSQKGEFVFEGVENTVTISVSIFVYQCITKLENIEGISRKCWSSVIFFQRVLFLKIVKL